MVARKNMICKHAETKNENWYTGDTSLHSNSGSPMDTNKAHNNIRKYEQNAITVSATHGQHKP